MCFLNDSCEDDEDSDEERDRKIKSIVEQIELHLEAQEKLIREIETIIVLFKKKPALTQCDRLFIAEQEERLNTSKLQILNHKKYFESL